MKHSKSCLIELIALVSLGFNVALTEKASAEAKFCTGADCNDKNPVEYQCYGDASVVEQVIKTVYRWQDFGQPQQIIIQKVYSEKCNANWTQAYIPDGSFLFMQERDLVNGTQPVRGMHRARGTGYFWAYGMMSNGYVVNQACVSLPVLSMGNGHDMYDRYCTTFSDRTGNSVLSIETP